MDEPLPKIIDDAVLAAFEARRQGSGLDLLPEQIDRDQALRLQLAVADRFASEEGDAIGGWKVGMTSGTARDTMGEGYRPFGYVLESRIFASGEEVAFDPGAPGAIEPEICLVMGTALHGADVTPETAAAAVRGVAPSFELLEQRVSATGERARATKLVDGLSNWGLVVGEEASLDRLSEVTTVHFSRDGELIATAVEGDNLLIDDVFLSLSRLCRLLHACGRGLESGQLVLTGSFAKTPAAPPSDWHASFSDIGEVSIGLR